MTTATKWAYILIAAIIAYLAFSTYSIWRLIDAEPPFQYMEDTYPPTVSELCPGDTLEAFYDVEIQAEPAVYIVVESIWSVDEMRTVVYDEHPTYTVHRDAVDVRQVLRRVVPTLPPGRYELRHAAQVAYEDADLFTVPFTIREDCK